MKEITGKAQVSLGDDNILFIDMLPKSNIEEIDAKEIIKAAEEVVEGKGIHCNLADISKMTFMSKSARNIFGNQNKKNVKAVAVVSNNSFQKSIVNLYMKFSKPIIPTQFFTDINTAKSWLLSELEK